MRRFRVDSKGVSVSNLDILRKLTDARCSSFIFVHHTYTISLSIHNSTALFFLSFQFRSQAHTYLCITVLSSSAHPCEIHRFDPAIWFKRSKYSEFQNIHRVNDWLNMNDCVTLRSISFVAIGMKTCDNWWPTIIHWKCTIGYVLRRGPRVRLANGCPWSNWETGVHWSRQATTWSLRGTTRTCCPGGFMVTIGIHLQDRIENMIFVSHSFRYFHQS